MVGAGRAYSSEEDLIWSSVLTLHAQTFFLQVNKNILIIPYKSHEFKYFDSIICDWICHEIHENYCSLFITIIHQSTVFLWLRLSMKTMFFLLLLFKVFVGKSAMMAILHQKKLGLFSSPGEVKKEWNEGGGTPSPHPARSSLSLPSLNIASVS